MLVELLLLVALVAPVAIVVGGIAWGIVWFQKREREYVQRAVDLCARYGFAIDTSRKGPPPQRFDAFGVGSRPTVRNHIWWPGADDSVFDFQYTTGGGKNSTTHLRTCALVRVPFRAPHTKLDAENAFTALGRRLGIRDIETESVRFNETYRVNGDDERFAITLLDGAFIDWLMNHTPFGPGSVVFELRDDWLLCITERLDVDRQLGFLHWASEIPSRFPTVLTSLYPAFGHPGSR